MSERMKVSARIQPESRPLTCMRQVGKTLLLHHQTGAAGVEIITLVDPAQPDDLQVAS